MQQIVFIEPADPDAGLSLAAGETARFDVVYTATNETLLGLGLVLLYDPEDIEISLETDTLFPNSLNSSQATAGSLVTNWAVEPPAAIWPGTGTTPLVLYSFTAEAPADFTGATLTFAGAPDVAAGAEFVAPPAIVAADGPPLVEPPTIAPDTEPPVVAGDQSFRVIAGQDAGSAIGTVQATDNFGVAAFAIASGNEAGFFAIDAAGNLTLTAAASDAEAVSERFVLGITASDAAGNSAAAESVAIDLLQPDEGAFSLDVDRDGGTPEPLTDGLNILRVLLGAPEQAIVLGPDALATDSQDAVFGRIVAARDGGILDFDRDGAVEALTDGLNILRVLLGAPEAAIALGTGSTLSQGEVVAAIEALA